MARVKIKFPQVNPLFSCTISVRISDINYGNHLGNDSLLSIIHEARMQFFAQRNFTELDAGGNSLIMADVMIAYKGEAFYGDMLLVDIYADEITEKSFDLLYKVTTSRNGVGHLIAEAKTGMACFDYNERKIVKMKEALNSCLKGVEN
ncbi:MAG TPA: thioesterase family protein [Flavipsychrobacter sp.]|nr:thioesterase family protein [Flavipsychrobacter sp.]